MEQVRNGRLDRMCEQIKDIRENMAQGRADEAGAERAALAEMRASNVQAYKHAGVELLRSPGEETLRVRVSRANATADVEDGADAAPDAGAYVDGAAV